MSLTVEQSVALLLQAQTPSGAIPASTVHEVYRYGWLRDGSWCAHALDVAGHHQAAAAWHHWVARTLLAHRHRFEEALQAVRVGAVDGQVMMPARFTLDGVEETAGDSEEDWPNFQTDCYGFWLWALADHVRRAPDGPDGGSGGGLDGELAQAARLVVDYLMETAQTPCFDCWEEHPGNVHTSSLAAVAAGLRDAGTLLADEAAQRYAQDLLARITGPLHTLGGAFVRFPGDTRVDGSLLWLAVPFGLVDVHDELFTNTLTRIHDELVVPGGGVRRYLGDTFYGGSEWILLAATYGWVAHERGDHATAQQMLTWIQDAATDEGFLPEQVQTAVQSPYMLRFWKQKWGATATPLLWSHAMHAIVSIHLHALDSTPQQQS